MRLMKHAQYSQPITHFRLAVYDRKDHQQNKYSGCPYWLLPVKNAGYGKHPSKKFVFDKNGVFINSNGSQDYVLSLEDLTQRIPDYEQRLEYDFTAPTVVEVYSESTPTGLRYLLAVRSGTLKSDLSSFEYIISLPEN